jgi:pyridinium-3,5-biscarboxylic acid mononucleotide synthase
MDKKYLLKLCEDIRADRISCEEAADMLTELPFKDVGFARIDNHRSLRTGYPEVVFCQGKTDSQIADIMEQLWQNNNTVMGTRATEANYRAVRERIPEAEYFEQARIIAASRQSEAKTGFIAVITAGTSDIPVAEEAAVTAEILGNNVSRIYDVGVAGIHRLFDCLDEIRNANAVIVCAGMEGALASVTGGLVDVPVIAVPTSVGYGAGFNGLAALLSMLNSCANGISVVNIDNGFGAAYTASMINRGRHE